MNTTDNWLDHDVYGSDGEKIGTVDALYTTDDSGEPTFATVKTGWFSGSSFVPLAGAQASEDGLSVPYTKQQVKDAPNIEPDSEISDEEEEALYRYYDMADDAADEHETSEEEGIVAGADHGTDTSGPDTDDAMTRSEEELQVGTRTVETGRYRLRKYVVTEQVTKTVPVQREEVRLEREPITDQNRGAALDGPDISEEEHEIVTHAEVPVVDKKVVPQERVHLATDVVRDERTVTDSLRKEKIDVDEDVER